jgi:hypothetical protein
MYLVILALIPVMMAASLLHRLLPVALSLALYALAWGTGLNLVGNPWTSLGWFFNPFAWQLIFFTGFGIGMGWLKPPPLGDQTWLALSGAIVVVSIPLSFWGFHQLFPVLAEVYSAILPGNEKTDLHWLRYLHFLALAYLVLSLVEPHKARLTQGLAMVVVKVGRQSLATFLVSLVAARIASLVFQLTGEGALVTLVINLLGIGLVVLTAFTVAWFKSSPWARKENDKTPVQSSQMRDDVADNAVRVTQALLPAPRT